MGHDLNEEKYLDSSEMETITKIISAMVEEADLRLCAQALDRARKLAAYVVKNEMITIQFLMYGGSFAGNLIGQRILCMSVT